MAETPSAQGKPAGPVSEADAAMPATDLQSQPRPTVADRRQTLRAKMIAIAGSIIADRGVQALNARDVANEAGCAVGTLYNLFPDLDALILEIQRDTLGSFEAEALLSLEASQQDTPADRLVALANSYLDFAIANPGRWRALFDHQLSSGYQVPDWYPLQERRLFELVGELVRPLLPRLPDDEALVVGRSLWAAVHGIIWLSLTGKIGPMTLDETRQSVETIVRAAARGFAAAY